MDDRPIIAVWVGVLVALLILAIGWPRNTPYTECYAYVKDGFGNTHVIHGYTGNDYYNDIK